MVPRFRNPEGVALATIAALAIGAAMDAYSLKVPPENLFTPAHVIIRLVTLACFAAWLDRIHRNLPAVGVGREQDHVWPTLSAFFPPNCFFRPPQLINEVWVASKPPFTQEKGSNAIVVWWMLLWIPPLMWIAMLYDLRAPHHPSADTLAKLIPIVNIAAAAAAIVVVRRVTTRLENAAARFGKTVAQPRTSTVTMPHPIAHSGTIPTFFRIATLAFAMLFTGVAFAVDAAMLLGMRHGAVAYASAAAYAAFAILFVVAAALLRNHRDDEPARWPLLAMTGVLFAIINVLALRELFPG